MNMGGDNERRTRAWAELVRLPEAIASTATTLAGALIAGVSWHHIHLVLLLVVGAALLSMGAAALNDFLDFKHDRTAHPGRPLPSGRLRRLHAVAASVFLTAAGMMAAGSAQPGCLRIALILCAGLLLYEFVLKAMPVGPATRAACRAIYLGLGLTLAPGETDASQFWLWGYLIGLVFMYWLGIALGSQPGRQLSARGRLILAGSLCCLAAVGMVMLPAWFDLAGSRLTGATLVGGVLALLGYRVTQAILAPSAGQYRRALDAARLASILLSAAAVAYTRNLWASVPVLFLIVPAVAVGWWLESPTTAPALSGTVVPVREKLKQDSVKAHLTS